MADIETRLVIVGGGPAGMMAGHLFARAGVETLVLEKHGDFLRDFRGDTVHPSTLRLFSELGLLDALLARPHDKVRTIGAVVGDREVEIADLSHFDTRWNFVAMMPQWEFLDFLADASRVYPTFDLRVNAEAKELIREGGRVTGVTAEIAGEPVAVRAELVIAADGRHSVLRGQAALPLTDLGAPMDIFWFRVPKERSPDNETGGYFLPGRVIVTIDRGDYWQCAFVFPKGGAERVRAQGLDTFKAEVAARVPALADAIGAVASWDEVKLLQVGLDRLESWHKPGLLVIGDAAHTMSPIGGVGINLAIQDAVAAANILAGPMAAREPLDALLPRVRERRLTAVRIIQGFQQAAQERIIGRLLATDQSFSPPFALRLLGWFPVLRRIPAALIGFGWRPEHIRSPDAFGDEKSNARSP